MYQNKGFFEKLLDVSFSSFIAPQVVGVLYTVGLIAAVLAGLGVVIQSLSEGGVVGGFFGLIIAAVVVLFYAIIARVSLESLVASIRTAENTRILAEDVLARKTNVG